MPLPPLHLVPSFYHTYLRYVQNEELAEAFNRHEQELIGFLNDIPVEKWSYRYAPEKWSIKEVVQHLIDAERIFCYRALAFARGDKAHLPGFDENSYAAASRADARSSETLKTELQIVQKAAALLFESFDETAMAATGVANGNSISVEAIGFIIIGHTRHHLHILKERYF